MLEFIQWLMDKQDDGVAAGDDILDITVDTPFDRSTDQIYRRLNRVHEILRRCVSRKRSEGQNE